jgi:hypothetical protein
MLISLLHCCISHSHMLHVCIGSACCSVKEKSTAIDWPLPYLLGFDSRRGLGIVLFTTASRTALEPTQPSIQCVPGALSLGIKRPGREADHSPPSSAEVKECVSSSRKVPINIRRNVSRYDGIGILRIKFADEIIVWVACISLILWLLTFICKFFCK